MRSEGSSPSSSPGYTSTIRPERNTARHTVALAFSELASEILEGQETRQENSIPCCLTLAIGRTMTKPLEFFSYKNGELLVEGVPLERIADTTGTPVYVYSADGLLTPLRELQNGLSSIDHRVCFAVKSNSNIAVLKLLSEAGAGMDLVSGGELFRASLADVPGEKIVFSGVGKTPGEMIAALEYDHGKGIYSFNVESVAELELLDAVALKQGKRAPVALRFNPDVDAKTHPYISTGLKKNKFGLNRAEVTEIFRNLKRFQGVEMKGLSIHIGSQLLDLSPLDQAFGKVKELMTELEAKYLDRPFAFVDIGGGLGITYKNEKAPALAAYCKLVLKHFGPKAKLERPLKILLEPGRRIAGNAGVLVSEVLYRKSRKSKDFLVIDAAMNDLLRPALYGSHHEIIPVRKSRSSTKLKATDVVGPVCETGDCFATDRKLPASLDRGELVALLSSGAYGFTMSSNYNSRPRPPEVLVQNGSFKVIRERESYDDLVRGEST